MSKEWDDSQIEHLDRVAARLQQNEPEMDDIDAKIVGSALMLAKNTYALTREIGKLRKAIAK